MPRLDERPADGTLVDALDGDVVDLDRLPPLHHLGRHPFAPANRGHSTERREQDRISLVGIVAHAEPELFARLVVLPDRAAGRPCELVRPRDDGLEHRFEIERRAQGAADLTECRQFVHGPRQLTRSSLQLAEQPRVLDGDGRLIGEGLQQGDLAVGERQNLVPLDGDRSQQLVRPEHGNYK